VFEGGGFGPTSSSTTFNPQFTTKPFQADCQAETGFGGRLQVARFSRQHQRPASAQVRFNLIDANKKTEFQVSTTGSKENMRVQ